MLVNFPTELNPGSTHDPDRTKVFITDLDGTKIRINCLLTVLQHMVRERIIEITPEVSTVLSRMDDSHNGWKVREKDFDSFAIDIIDAWIKAIKGLALSKIQESTDYLIEQGRFDEVYVFSSRLFRQARDDGYFLILLSHSHNEIVSRIGSYYGYHISYGTQYKVNESGILTGKIYPGYEVAYSKRDALDRLASLHGLELNERTIVLGDTSSDISMFELVDEHEGSVICINPSRKLYTMVLDKNHWHCVWERKDLILSDIPQTANPCLRDLVIGSGMNIEDIHLFARSRIPR